MILVDDPGAAARVKGAGSVGLYARVSSHDQRADLDRQVTRLSEWAAKAGMRVERVEAEVGSGMNGARSKVRRLLADPNVTTVVVEHRDRLGRMNTELIEAALAAQGRSVMVLDAGEVDDDLVRDHGKAADRLSCSAQSSWSTAEDGALVRGIRSQPFRLACSRQ